MRCIVFVSVLPLVLLASPIGEKSVERVSQQSWEAERLYDRARYDAAALAYADAIPALTASFGEAHDRTLIAINNYAAALLRMNRGGEAETILRDALDRRQRAGLAEDDNLTVTWNNLGEALLSTGRVTAAISLHERALALKQHLHRPDHPEVAVSLTNLAEALRQAGELTRARALFERAAQVWAAPARGRTGAAAVPLMPGYARAMNSLGLLYDTEGKRDEAGAAFTEALKAITQTYGPRHELAATLHFNLAAHSAKLGEWKRAEEHCRLALDVYEVLPAFHDNRLAFTLDLHARILDRLRGRKDEAKAQRRRAGAILTLR